MAKIALIVPKKNNALEELRLFLSGERADIYIFPEGFLTTDIIDDALELIRQNGSFVITGYKDSGASAVREKVLVIDGGRIAGEYTKCILTPAEKAKGKVAGELIHCIDTKFGRMAFPICYEIHFSEIARIMCLDDPVMIVNLIGTGMYHELQYDQWTSIAKVRAIENETYVLGCSHYAGEIPLAFAYTNSGEKRLEAKGEHGAFFVEVDLTESNHRNINYAADRVPELFSRLCSKEDDTVKEIVMNPIGYVRNDVSDTKDVLWGEDVSEIVLNDEYLGGFDGLEDFSHVNVIYYLDKAHFDKEKHLRRRAQNREDMPLVGIFSQRGKDRPNQIGTTSVEIVEVTGKVLTVRGLDAVDGTPVLDIKPYYPVYDKKEAAVPEWVDRLMKHYF